ncbi:anhydro-N-acetylmuramic acid kinase [Bacteroidetes/Chlorobi group bacterium ChocPot_Mid]|jgi:anhydro-N-acetylmuramic acid kinase|nr:MAG: anhydro-N-acetylmuramic acid kinase [Bacteroidetes/Chlorobi group bacterium ChocPot_Mid]
MRDKAIYFNPKKWLSEPRIVIGLMSGTSLDGIDASLVRFWIENNVHKFHTIGFYYLPFSSAIKTKILNVINHKIFVSDISNLNFLLANYYNKAVKSLLIRNNFKSSDVDLIGLHGQTVWHKPPYSTYQLGSASVLNILSDVPVISDFRSADIALGGQGAPLVPIFDKVFLSDNNKNTIALNIGGMANITYLPRRGSVIAFDTGPGNVLIDSFARKLFKKDFDRNGKFAMKGNLSFELFSFLKQLKFIGKKPPKSTGRELFNTEYINKLFKFIIDKKISEYDAMNTLTKFTSWSIAENIRKFTDEKSRIIVSGGGARNSAIMLFLQDELPLAEIKRSDDIGINSDAKESICFAYLAWRNIANLTGNIKSVTGANKEVILGSLSIQ